MDTILNHIVQVLITGVGMALAYFFGRKKNIAEVRKLEASATVDEILATEKAVAIWRGLAQELRGEVEELRNLIGELKNEIDDLKNQNEALRAEMELKK